MQTLVPLRLRLKQKHLARTTAGRMKAQLSDPEDLPPAEPSKPSVQAAMSWSMCVAQ